METGLGRTAAGNPDLGGRRVDFDWLRVIIILIVVAFHAMTVFGFGTGGILAAREWFAPFSYFIAWVFPWMMPLLFVVSGASTHFALRSRSSGRYVAERFKRLFIPCLFGTFVLVPPQIYCRRLWDGDFTGSLLSFYPRFVEGVWPQGNLTYGHLWFILYLFACSLIALPLFRQLNRPWGQRLTSRLAALCDLPCGIFLFVVPLALVQLALRPSFPWTFAIFNDWAMLSWYLCLYVFGYIMACDPRFWAAVQRNTMPAFVGGIMLTSIDFWLERALWWLELDRTFASGLVFLFMAMRTWFWIVAALGLAAKWLRFESPRLPYIREASYPFYIIHQTVLIAIAYHVLKWHTHVMVRFTVITVATVVVTLAIYEVAVRRWAVTRFLFGMRPKPKRTE